METMALLLLAAALLIGWPLLVLRWLTIAWPAGPRQASGTPGGAGRRNGDTSSARLSLAGSDETLYRRTVQCGTARKQVAGEEGMLPPYASEADRQFMLAILRTYAREYRQGHSRPPMAEARLRELVDFAERLLRAHDVISAETLEEADAARYVSWPTDNEVEVAASNPGQLMIWSYFLPAPANEEQRKILGRVTYFLSPAIRSMARTRPALAGESALDGRHY